MRRRCCLRARFQPVAALRWPGRAGRRRGRSSPPPASPPPTWPAPVWSAGRCLSSLVVEVRRLLAEGETVRLRLLRRARQGRPRARTGRALRARAAGRRPPGGAILSTLLPTGAALVVTSDHGQVEVGTAARLPGARSCSTVVELLSGEGRFRWLHARPGRSTDDRGGGRRGVLRRRGVGPDPPADGRRRAGSAGRSRPRWPAGSGDVALVAHAPVAFLDPADTGETRLHRPARVADPGRDVRFPGGVDARLTAPDRRGADRFGRIAVGGRRERSRASWDGPDRRDTVEAVLIEPGERGGRPERGRHVESVEQPAKVMRIGSMVKQLLDEVRRPPWTRPAGPGCGRSTSSRSGSWPGRSAPTWPPSSTGCRSLRRVDPVRGGAADRPGPAGGLARGPLPRHPGHPGRPADGGPGPARGDAPARACRRAGEPGDVPACPGTYL